MAIFADVFVWLTDHPGVLVAAFSLYVFIYVVSVFFSGPKPGPNPLKKDTSRPPKPLVTDQAERDKVIKCGFSPKRVPENLDAIVIGSGIGGLSVAGLLSRAGKKVLVLEQHDQAGGCCHTFIEDGFEFDVGIHYIGGMRKGTLSRLLVDQLTDGQLQWSDLDKEYDVVALGQLGKQKLYAYEYGSKEIWRASVLKKFPGEEKAVDKFIQCLQDVRKSMIGQISLKLMSKTAARILINTGLIHRFTKFFKYADRTVEEVLDELTDNADLKAVLGYGFGDYGVEPNKASFAMHALLTNHYVCGASYPRGGASEIAFHIIPVIEKSGGKVLVRAPVTEVLFDSKGKAIGVRVGKSSGATDVFAPLVISDAGIVNTFTSLVPQEHAKKSAIYKMIHEKKVGCGAAAISLFVGLKGTTEELGLKAQNIWSFTGNNLSQIIEDYFNLDAATAVESDVPLIFVSFPSAKDPTYKERYPGKSVAAVIALANWKWFEQWKDERVMKRGAEYEVMKMAIGRRMWENVLSLYPQLEDKVEYFTVGSPLSNQYYLGSAKGEIYGLDHSKDRFASPEIVMNLRPETDIPGLAITGQDILSCGFMGALFGGVLCASHVLHRNIWEDLVQLKKTADKTK